MRRLLYILRENACHLPENKSVIYKIGGDNIEAGGTFHIFEIQRREESEIRRRIGKLNKRSTVTPEIYTEMQNLEDHSLYALYYVIEVEI